MLLRLVMFLYRLLEAAAAPFLLVYLAIRALRDPEWRRAWTERFGKLPPSFRQTAPGAVWLHAVSVGEVLSAVGLVARLRERLPAAPVFVSVTTTAGRRLAEQRLAALADGIFYCPLDYCFAVRAVLRRLRPRLVVILETEIWPNLWREAKRCGCALLVVNARISDRALGRYRLLRPVLAPILALPDAILAQSELSRRRYGELGAPQRRVRAVGNLKYDVDPTGCAMAPELAGLLERVRPELVFIAASTMPPAEPEDPDEDRVVVDAFLKLAAKHRGLLMILAPRRPQRFEEAAQLLRRAGVRFLRRSMLGPEDELELPGVLLLDSIGELAATFRAADVVFMGGTLASRGGHNILEPAAFAKPVIMGPHMENFPAIVEAFRRAGAVVEIAAASELAGAVEGLLRDAARRAELGERARRAAEAERGATERAVAEMFSCYSAAAPRFFPPQPLAWALTALSRLWCAGGRWKQRRDESRRVKLATPVISVGGLSMGGAGKTPFTLWLAERLREQGYRPAILTRGYRREVAERSTILEAGAEAPPERTGEEAQIYLRAGVAAVGIGADRGATGRELEKRFRPDVFLLDDGFQHRRLARDLDIVLVDALQPLDHPFPLGFWREPPQALARADCIVITRCELTPDPAPVEAWLRRYNAAAPIYRARTRPEAWIDGSGRAVPLERRPFHRPVVFCGLAQPEAFRRTLRLLGIRSAYEELYPDHHRYQPSQLRRLAARARAAGADALLTTEKDFHNLPPGWQACVAGLPLYWLKASVAVEEEQDLLAAIAQVLGGVSQRAD